MALLQDLKPARHKLIKHEDDATLRIFRKGLSNVEVVFYLSGLKNITIIGPVRVRVRTSNQRQRRTSRLRISHGIVAFAPLALKCTLERQTLAVAQDRRIRFVAAAKRCERETKGNPQKALHLSRATLDQCKNSQEQSDTG